ncbi:MAG TPA: hypothetical protein VFU93_08830 [Acidimicrobiales bacterium]|nr:hypothetical protein [Acidimicrobiales bacterium]
MDADDVRAMQSLAATVWRLRPEIVNVDATVGELAWVWGTSAHEADSFDARIWRDGDDVVAWAWRYPPQELIVSEDRREVSPPSLVWQVHPHRPDLLDEVFAAFAFGLTHVRTCDEDAIAALERCGFGPAPDEPWHHLNTRSLDAIEPPVVPDGYELVTIDDVEAFVDGHRRAWEGSSLTAERYETVMATWPYRADLDVGIRAPDGTIVSRATAWLDEANRTVELEPVGTDAAHRQRGLGRACNLFALLQARAAGATSAIVGCRGDDHYPVPRRLYWSIGFTPIARDVAYVHR